MPWKAECCLTVRTPTKLGDKIKLVPFSFMSNFDISLGCLSRRRHERVMGLLRSLRRRDRCYSLLVGFFLVYMSWSFLSSQVRIDSLRRGRDSEDALGLPSENRKVHKGIDIPHESSDDDDHVKPQAVPFKHSHETKLHSNELAIPKQLIDLSSPTELNPPNKVDTKNSDTKPSVVIENVHVGTDKSKSSPEDLPRPLDSAFNERVKMQPFAPAGGNSFPNYFLHAERFNKTRSQYGETVVTYLHHNKAAGSSVKDCLSKVAKSQRKRVALMDSNGRLASVKRLKQRRGAAQFYMGGYSFGLCEQLSPQPCSYFTFVRDPYERVISSYSYCRRAATDQLCQPGDPWAMSIKEWVLFQGSFLFRQILLRPEFCQLPRPAVDVKSLNTRAVPCWYKEKLHLEKQLNATAREDLMNYVITNLDKWFAVIGVTEEYDTSLAMLEEAYGIPFHGKCSGKKINVSDYKNVDKSVSNETEHDVFVRKTKAELMADKDVRDALRADIRIYEQAKLIFEKQREKYKLLHDLT